MICRLCSEPVSFHDGVMFGVSRRSADARQANIECAAVETLRLIYQREVDRTLGSLVMPEYELRPPGPGAGRQGAAAWLGAVPAVPSEDA
jgi:hypothetical protein